MDMTELRRRILFGALPTIGGLPVLLDNAALNGGTSVKWNEDYSVDNDYFVTGWYDTGSTTSKNYRFAGVKRRGSLYNYLRWYNDKTGNNVDYWGANNDSEKVITNTPGRFVVATVYKPKAADFYLYCDTDQRYIIRGSNV